MYEPDYEPDYHGRQVFDEEFIKPKNDNGFLEGMFWALIFSSIFWILVIWAILEQ